MLALVSEFLNQVLFTCNSYIFTKVDRRNNSWRLEHQLMLPSSAWLLTPNCRTQVLKQVHALFCKRSCTNYVIFCMLASHSWSNLGEWCWLASLTLTPSGIQFSWTYIDQWSCSFSIQDLMTQPSRERLHQAEKLKIWTMSNNSKTLSNKKIARNC